MRTRTYDIHAASRSSVASRSSKCGRAVGAQRSAFLRPSSACPPAMATRTGNAIVPACAQGGVVQYFTATFDRHLTASIVARFKAAHAPAALAAGLSREQIAAEAVVFDVPAVWGLPLRSGERDSVRPIAAFVAQACRFHVTALSPADVRSVCVAADALARLNMDAQANDEAAVAAALAPLSSVDARERLTSFMFALDMPRRCNAYAFCVNHDAVVVVRAELDLDVQELRRACRREPAYNTLVERCRSRSLCVWCGASPFARGVTLHECPHCAFVAYCSEECRAADFMCEHWRECGHTTRGTTPTGKLRLAQHELGLTRAATLVEHLNARTGAVIAASGLRRDGEPRDLALAIGLDDKGVFQIAIPMGYYAATGPHQPAAYAARAAPPPPQTPPPRRCSLPSCGAAPPAGERLKVCAACKRAAYCSQAHQHEHWAQGHKQQCKEWRDAA